VAEKTAIEWCDSTWNPWIGCTKVGPGCDHCYAETLMDTRHHRVKWGPGQARSRTSAANWTLPLRWNRSGFCECAICRFRGDAHGTTECPACGGANAFLPARRRVFSASLADVFDNEVDPQWRADLWELIASCRDVDFLLLTKRIGNVKAMLPVMDSKMPFYKPWNERWPWQNVWIGATVVNQEEADRDIPKLLAIPARVRFLSIEPMLGPINLTAVPRRDDGWMIDSLRGLYSREHEETFDHPAALEEHDGGPRIDWVIAGGESGHRSRPAHPDWFRSLRDQCAAAGVPFLFKQWGEWAPGECAGQSPTRTERTATLHFHGWHFSALTPRESEEVHRDDAPDLYRIGKKAAGRLLDGQEHNGFPA
jgi:protein gp37